MLTSTRRPILIQERKKPKYQIIVDTELCDGCELCVHFCPKDVLAIGHGTNTRMLHYVEAANPDDCVGCEACERVCPSVAIFVKTRGE